MANCLLTLSHLANIALVEALDLGFNACEAESWIDSETFNKRLVLKFGDAKEMNRPRMRTPCEWARAYEMDAICFREPKLIELPFSYLSKSTDEIRKKITSELLELLPSGPAGVKSDLFDLVEQ